MMGLFERALETYEANKNLVGVYEDGKNAPLAPVAHIARESGIVITLSSKGDFKEARREKAVIIFPVTEDSIGSRTGTGAKKRCRPLCDRPDYLLTEHFISKLEKWAESEFSHDTVKCVLAYIKRRTLIEDLANSIGKKKEDLESIVRWYIAGLPVGQEGACWRDKTLFDAFTNYYMTQIAENKRGFCMISGEQNCLLTEKHPGLIFGNAKLISTNQAGSITFSGRFASAEQACTVSFTVSQKAHNALRWLTENQGIVYGQEKEEDKKEKEKKEDNLKKNRTGCVFLCWNPQGEEILNPAASLFGFSSDVIVEPSDYKDKLNSTLLGFKKDRQLDGTETAVTALFEAATTGRTAVTYYSEFTVSDLLDRMRAWDESCCWLYRDFSAKRNHQSQSGDETEKDETYHGVQAPSLLQIIDYAFGKLQGKKFETEVKTIRQQIQRLIVCKMNRDNIPKEIKTLLVQRANHMELYGDDKEWGFLRSRILFVTCAVIHKYRHDKTGEEWEMALEPERKDISYQYGRLLAVLEKAERDTYDDDEKREPNAVRMQLTYVKRPMHTAQTIWGQIRTAYMPQLTPKTREFYHKLIGEIMEQISRFSDEEQRMPLDDTYMLGYYLQRNSLYTKKDAKD